MWGTWHYVVFYLFLYKLKNIAGLYKSELVIGQ